MVADPVIFLNPTAKLKGEALETGEIPLTLPKFHASPAYTPKYFEIKLDR
jgi:hypothetical protein